MTNKMRIVAAAHTVVAENDRQQLLHENQTLKAQLNELICLAKGAPLESGVCLCGDATDEHTQAHGHSPVDIWDHAFNKFLDKHGLHKGVQTTETNTQLAYTDPESPNPEIDNKIYPVSGISAGKAYNSLCLMLGGRYPDLRIQEEAPQAHQFFMTLLGANKPKD